MAVDKIVGDGHDYVALSWVKNEIISNLDQVQKALESLTNSAACKEDIISGLVNCHDLLHQISGALNMVGFPGAALFSEEIKTFCSILIDHKVDNFDHSLQILAQAVLQMSPYLDIIQTEGHDIPIALLPLINEMRACYQASPLSEVELFSPKYYGTASPLSDEELKEINTEGLTNLLRKLRQSLQLSLIDLIHNRNFIIALDHLIKIFNYLGRLCKATPISTLWRVAHAVVIAINERSISNSSEVKSLLKQIDLQIKLLVEKGVVGMNSRPPESLIRDLLFLLTQIDSHSEEINRIKKEFHLSDSIVSVKDINIQQAKFINIDGVTLKSVLQALEEEFIFVKDRLDLFSRSKDFNDDELKDLPDILKKIANTLDILGLTAQKALVDKQQAIISHAVSMRYLDNAQAIDVAETLLSVENAVNNIVANSSQSEVGGIQETVLKEISYELAQVKDILSLYFDSEGREGSLVEIVELLTHTAGALSIISQQRAAAVTICCLKYIQDNLINNTKKYLTNDEIESIVGAIASIDYYTECLAKNQIVSAKDALNFAARYLNELNYPLPEDYQSLTNDFVLQDGKAVANENTQHESLDDVTIPTDSSNPTLPKTKTEHDESGFEIDEELVEIFSEEMEEILDSLSTTLPEWIVNIDNKDMLTEVRRSFHTIKGSGRMVKASVIGELGWAIENMLNRVLDKTISPTPVLLNVIQETITILPDLIEEFASGKQHEREDVNYFSAVAHALADKQELPVRETDVIIHDLTFDEVPVLLDSPIIEEGDLPREQELLVVEDQPEPLSSAFDIELIDIFIAEAKTHMQALKVFVTLCERSLPQVVTDSLQRAMHTLKGSALMANLDSIANIAKPFEGFLKECSINAWPIERIDFELLRDAYSLLNTGIRQLELYSLAPVDGTDSLIERIRLRREYLLSQLEITMSTAVANTESVLSVSEIINQLMSKIDLLLDADDDIKQWQAQPETSFSKITALCEELNQVLTLAKQATLKPIADLSEALLRAYDAVKSNVVKRDSNFFEALSNVHHALLNCIDQLAAAQLISEYPEEIQVLDQLISVNDVKTSDGQELPLLTQNIKSESEIDLDDKISPESIIKPEVALSLPEQDFIAEDKLILGAPAPAGPIIESDEIDPEMAEIFLEEADDIIAETKHDLDGWIKDQNPDYLKDLQRQLHTLKGGARMCGARGLGDVAHGLEFIYEGLLSGRYSYSANLIELLNKSHEFIQFVIDTLHETATLPHNPELLRAIQIFRQEGQVVLDNVNVIPSDQGSTLAVKAEEVSDSADDIATEVIDYLPQVEEKEVITNDELQLKSNVDLDESSLITDDTSIPVDQGVKEVVNNVVEFKPLEIAKSNEQVSKQVTTRELSEQIKVSAELLDSLVNLAGETSIYRSRVEQQNSDLATVLVEMEATIDRVRDQLRRLDMETQTQIISKHQTESSSSYTEFDPLEMDQYSQLQQLSRSLFESASDLQDLKDTLMRRNRDVETLLQQQGRINTELQEGLMRTRMVPLERIAPRLRRLVRQISAELGKEVDLVIGNTAGEMDRGLIDAIVVPLEHMIRNSIDHGIETKEARIAAGKPVQGTIHLDLIREGGEMVLRLKDDGAGISVGVVREKAIDKGLIRPEEFISDKEILQFILEAGFSTAKKVTQISGRGVGLDVVMNAVKQLGGILSLDSKEGEGTVFAIRLPINLSVSRALMIRVADDCYAIPMSTVEGVTYISPEQNKEFQQFGTAELEYGGDIYRVKYLGELLGDHVINSAPQIIEEKQPVLLVRSGDNYVALRVDELLPSNEVVVKSLGAQFLSVPAISGATILGDGNVIIILDLSALVRSYFVNHQHQAGEEERRIIPIEESVEVKRPPLVMVVDDSVTVRKVTTRLLERQGMQVVTARDGLDAVTQLEEKVPDIMLLDIEMPRMDGFEVATRVRHDERTKNLPIIMITSRSGDKHRERALAIGVNEYMSKPFMDAKLIKSISDLLPSFEVNLLESSS